MAYTFNTTPSGTVEVLQDGQRISTTTPQNAAMNYGYVLPGGTPASPTAYQEVQNAGGIGIGQTNTNQSSFSATPPPPPTPPAPITATGLTQTTTPLKVAETPTSPIHPVDTLPDVSSTPVGSGVTLTPEQQKAQALSSRIQDLNTSTIGKSAYQVEQERLAGVPGYQSTINDLGAQLTGLKNEAAAIPLQLQQGAAERGVTTPVLGRQENSRLRTNAIAALGVSTLLAAAQGQLANAQSMADKAVSAKYDPIEEEIKADTANYNLIINSPEATLDEKKQAAQLLAETQARTEALAQKKADASNVLKVGIDAASNIANFKPSESIPRYEPIYNPETGEWTVEDKQNNSSVSYPTQAAALAFYNQHENEYTTGGYSTAAQALQAITNASTPQEALQIAASAGLTAGGSSALGVGSNPNTILSPSQAKTLGVPYGTTVGQAADMGITPSGGTSGTPIGKGTPSGFTQTDIKAGDSVLRTGKDASGNVIGNPIGSDGYIDPAVYVQMLNHWITTQGTRDAFFSYYPVQTYINPANTWVWAQLGIANPNLQENYTGTATTPKATGVIVNPFAP